MIPQELLQRLQLWSKKKMVYFLNLDRHMATQPLKPSSKHSIYSAEPTSSGSSNYTILSIITAG